MSSSNRQRSDRRAVPSSLAAAVCGLLGLGAVSCKTGPASVSSAQQNRDAVAASFERWRARSGGPFELLADSATWTIVGSSPLSKTYPSKRHFIEEVIQPFNARVAEPLMPTVHRIYSEGDTVIVHFDGAAPARDGSMYRNTYAWFLDMRDGRIVRATAFFDTRLFDDFWNRVSPSA